MRTKKLEIVEDPIGIMKKAIVQLLVEKVKILQIANLIVIHVLREVVTSRLIKAMDMILIARIINSNNILKCCVELILKRTSGIKIII